MDPDSREQDQPSELGREANRAGGPIRRGEAAPGATGVPRPRSEGSLYEATLKERRPPRLLNLVWVVIAGSILAGLATFFWGSDPDPQLLEQAQRPSRQADGPSLTEQLLSEIRSGRRAADTPATGETDSAPDAAGADAATSPETPRAAASRPPAARSASPSKADQPVDSAPSGRAVRPLQAGPGAGPAAQGTPPAPAPSSSGRAAASTTVTLPPNSAAATPPAARAANSTPPVEPGGETKTSATENQSSRASDSPETAEVSSDSAKLDAALRVLQRESSVASRLLAGSLATLELRDHRIVHETAREVWVDLVAKWRNADAEIHLIWAVDLEREAVRPLSSEARRLEETSRSS